MELVSFQWISSIFFSIITLMAGWFFYYYHHVTNQKFKDKKEEIETEREHREKFTTDMFSKIDNLTNSFQKQNISLVTLSNDVEHLESKVDTGFQHINQRLDNKGKEIEEIKKEIYKK